MVRQSNSTIAPSAQGPDGKSIKGEHYDELIKIVAQRTGETPASLAAALPYFNPEARLQVDDIAEQIDVYKSLKLVDQALRVDPRGPLVRGGGNEVM